VFCPTPGRIINHAGGLEVAEWVQKGWFLDFQEIEPRFRPVENYRFFYVVRQRMTKVEDITTTVEAGKTAKVELENILKVKDKNTVYQCAYGVYPNVKTFLEHPIDIEVGKLPAEKPSEQYRVGIIDQTDSPYDNPNLDRTEFWVIKNVADKPVIHVYNPYDVTLKVYIKLIVNMLLLEPVTDKETINQLERRIKPSTPVYLKFFEV